MRRSSSGRALITGIISSATTSAVRSSGRCSRPTNPLERSTRVPIWEAEFFPMIRSPSQCPGSARSSASGGRSAMLIMPTIRPRVSVALVRFRVTGAAISRQPVRAGRQPDS